MRIRRHAKTAAITGSLVVLFLCSACLQLPGIEDPSGPEIVWQTLVWDGLDRVYGIYVPESVVDPAPLVFLLHGGGGSAAKTWGQEHGRSWKTLADAYGFVLVVPEGIADDPGEPGHHWNDCRPGLHGSPIETGADDVGFITQLIGVVSADQSIDLDRVYVTGASNGGMMTYRLALEAGEYFASAAAIIANLPDPSECTGTPSPIPILIMSGTEDPIMPYEGGCVAGELCLRGSVLSTADTVSYWIGVNGASTEPTAEKLRNRAWFDGSRVTVYRFDGGSSGEDVVYYHVNGGGHNVPGYERESKLVLALSGPKNRDIDGPAEIWAFFQESGG